MMTHSAGKSVFIRAGEWIAALIGAVNCIIVPLAFAQSQEDLFPLPGLYFIEISLVGLLVLGFVALRPGLGWRWLALPWVAAGIILAFVVLGGFTIGFYLVPALIAFILTGFLVELQTGGAKVRHFGLLIVAAIGQAALMILFLSIL